MDIAECPGTPEGCRKSPLDLGNFLFEEGISHVLWFKEEWTMGPVAAPYLETGEEQDLGQVAVRPLQSDRLDEVDGWVFFEVAATAN